MALSLDLGHLGVWENSGCCRDMYCCFDLKKLHWLGNKCAFFWCIVKNFSSSAKPFFYRSLLLSLDFSFSHHIIYIAYWCIWQSFIESEIWLLGFEIFLGSGFERADNLWCHTLQWGVLTSCPAIQMLWLVFHCIFSFLPSPKTSLPKLCCIMQQTIAHCWAAAPLL